MNKIQLSAAVALLSASSVFAQAPSTGLVRGYPMCVPYNAQEQSLGQCRNRRAEVRDQFGRLHCRVGNVKIVSEAPVRYCPEPVIL